MYYLIRKNLTECSASELRTGGDQFVAVLTAEEWEKEKDRFDMGIDLDLNPEDIHNTKIEVNYDSLTGSFCIPDRQDLAVRDSGKGFAFADLRGEQANDPFKNVEGKIITLSNNNGGINGGISNGMPIVFRTVIKPTPSIAKKQETIDLVTKENTQIQIKGRHDPAIIHRARIVQDALSALIIADLMVSAKGSQALL